MKIDKKHPLVIRVLRNGNWHAKQDGKHLTAQETASLIAKGEPYMFIDV